MEDIVDNKSRNLLAQQYRFFAYPSCQFHSSLGGLLTAIGAFDHFHQPHMRGGVEEVHVDGSVFAIDNRCNFADYDRGGVRGQNRVRWAKCIEATEEVLLDLQVFKDGFDHEVCLTCRIFEGLDRPDALPCSGGLLLAEPPFSDAVL